MGRSLSFGQTAGERTCQWDQRRNCGKQQTPSGVVLHRNTKGQEPDLSMTRRRIFFCRGCVRWLSPDRHLRVEAYELLLWLAYPQRPTCTRWFPSEGEVLLARHV